MAAKQLKAVGNKYLLSVPVFRVPSDEDFDNFSRDPLGSDRSNNTETRRSLAAKKFYASLRYPDGEVDVKYKR